MPRTDRRVVLLMALSVLTVLVPFLFWRQAWFGRRLTASQIEEYLNDDAHPRNIQHALAQVADRIAAGDPAARRWYPRMLALARHPKVEIRTIAAWTLGQDNRSEAFHQTLRELLNDQDVMVRRNAALSLARFGDASGRAELVDVLGESLVRAPRTGRLSVDAKAGQTVSRGTLLARLQGGQGPAEEVRAPFPGRVERIAARDGAQVETGEPLVWLSAESGQVWEVLRGLYLVGQPQDLPTLERYAAGVSSMPDRIRQQALLTAQAIRTRAERAPSR